MSTDHLVAAHWNNFIYRRVARNWHALWCRWLPSGELKQRFHAERIFKPVASGADGTTMQVIYHYDDERGTVSTGPPCGPWDITEEQSKADGLAHPNSPDSMTTLLLPGGPSAWCMKQSPSGAPCAVEMFLHHEEHQRVSFGVIHAPDGKLQQLSLIREDTRGPWPQSDWSATEEATRTTPDALQAALAGAGAPIGAVGSGFAISASLEQSTLASVPWSETRVANPLPADATLLCADGTAALVAPEQASVGWDDA